MWSRRELLAALGASGASVTLGGWLGACAGPQQSTRRRANGVQHNDLLPQLLEIVDAKVSDAFVWSRLRKRHRVSRDSEEQNFDLLISEDVVIGGDGHSIGFSGASREELLSGAKRFVATLPAGSPNPDAAHGPFELPPQQDIVATFIIDPASQPNEAFHRPIAELFDQSQSVGSSRIIYRNAYSLSDDDELRFLSRTQNQRRRELRQRRGVLFAAWTGDDIVKGAAEHSGAGGLELPSPSANELQWRAQDVLAHVHARSAPSGLQDVILSPECASLVAMEAIAKPAFRNGLGPEQNALLRVKNDPTRKRGYGNYLGDARGDSPKAIDLFGEQTPASMEKGNLRRDNELRVRARPSNVVVQPTAVSEQELIAAISKGVYLDAPIHCSVDPEGRALALLCGRGREIHDGRFTGRLFSRVLCSAACASFLSETRGLGNVSRALAFEEGGLAMSAQAPAWLSRAHVGAAS